VMKFDGTSWVNVGIAGFSVGEVWTISLAFNPFDGDPYVAFTDCGNFYKVTVMKFNGSNWENVGNPGFSKGSAWYTSLAFNLLEQPCVAFVDSVNSWKASVMKYDGNNWVDVGSAGFSEGRVAYTSLAFSPSGQPYVAFADSAYSWEATLMKYDSVFVGMNEQHESGFSVYPNPASKSITIDFKNISGNLSDIEIVDLNGVRMFKTQINVEKLVLNIENYPAGIYFVKVKTTGSNWIGKFRKE
jgi:hypothetical protein